jgi:hypothetical protein
MFDNANTMSTTVTAGVDDAISRAAAAALLADVLLIPLELCLPAVVEVAQRDANLDLDIVSARLSSLVVTTTAKESAEQIEGVVVAAASLLPLLQAIVSVLVVYRAGLRITKGFVCLGDLDEFGLRSFVTTVALLVDEREWRGGQGSLTYGFLSGWNFLLS